MKERIARLISVKSFVTIVLTIVVAILTLKGEFDIKDIYLMVISFYFGTQTEKNKANEEYLEDKLNKQ
jgi:hypothetical protein